MSKVLLSSSGPGGNGFGLWAHDLGSLVIGLQRQRNGTLAPAAFKFQVNLCFFGKKSAAEAVDISGSGDERARHPVLNRVRLKRIGQGITRGRDQNQPLAAPALYFGAGFAHPAEEISAEAAVGRPGGCVQENPARRSDCTSATLPA